MTINSDITIFNTRIGTDRREQLYTTVIKGVSWYETKGQSATGTVRTSNAQCTVRIPYTATTENDRQYVIEEKYGKLSDEEIEDYWTIQKGAYIARGQYGDKITDLAHLRKECEGLYTITEYADNTVRGSDTTKHWRIGGA